VMNSWQYATVPTASKFMYDLSSLLRSADDKTVAVPGILHLITDERRKTDVCRK